MKVLLYSLNFAPEPTGIGKYSGEMAAWLAERGHDVRVISAPPYYPEWKLQEGYGRYWPRMELWQGIKVWRAPLWVPRRPNGAKRLIHLASFALTSIPSLLRQWTWRPDAVIVVAPALACAPAALVAARLFGAQAWLHVQDFEVDAAFKMGLLKGRFTQRVVTRFERWVLGRFDRVSTISGRMMALLRDKGVPDARAVSFPNWVDVSAIACMPTTGGAYRRELGIPDEAVVALYSGSMAGKQGLELLPAAARAVQERFPNLIFVFCGEGVFKPSLVRDCAGLANVRHLPLQPAERLGELLGMADIHLLPQQAQAADLVMPSKLTGMMSSGRPTLATAMSGTELASVVNGRGMVVPPGDLGAFTDALAALVGDPARRAELGAAARCFAESSLARDRVLSAFEDALRRCVSEANTVAPDLPPAAPLEPASESENAPRLVQPLPGGGTT